MAKDFAKAFYRSRAWIDCKRAYAASVGGLCEECRAKGKIEPGVIVHHIVHLNPQNIGDPTISLAFSNLKLLCHACHDKTHGYGPSKSYKFLPDGTIVPR